MDGPDNYYSPDVPASRGQVRTIQELALRLMGIDVPKSRLDASAVIVRLREGLIAREAVGGKEKPF